MNYADYKKSDEEIIEQNFDETTGVYTCIKPIEGNGQTITEVSVKGFSVKDLKELGKITDKLEQSIFMLQKSTGMAPSDIDCMDAKDGRILQSIIENFI